MLTKEKLNDGSIGEGAVKRLIHSKKVYSFLGRDDYENTEFNESPITLKKKDIVVLMTDGVYESINWKDIENILSKTGNVEKKAKMITSLVKDKKVSKQDNMGVILIKVLNG